jgi:hypothetical protein
MNTLRKLTAVCALALTGVAAFAPQAKAVNGIGGFGGHPQNSSTASCFAENYGAVTSSCTSNPAWEVSMPCSSPGSYWTPSLHVKGNGFLGTVICGADAVSNDGQSIYTSAQQSAANAQTLNYSVWVPASGYLFSACYMGSGTEWYSVNY